MAVTALFYYLLLERDINILNVSSEQMGDHSLTIQEHSISNKSWYTLKNSGMQKILDIQ